MNFFSFVSPSDVCFFSSSKDEDEDWGRWRDVVFRAKGALAPHGIRIKPPPPQNRRKRGGLAFVEDQCKAKKEEERAAGAEETAEERALEGTETQSVQLTTKEALEQIATMSQSFDSEVSVTPDVTPTATANGMTYCPECYLPLHPDPKPERLYIFLHALRYTTSLGCFETELPAWAAKGWEWDRS